MPPWHKHLAERAGHISLSQQCPVHTDDTLQKYAVAAPNHEGYHRRKLHRDPGALDLSWAYVRMTVASSWDCQ